MSGIQEALGGVTMAPPDECWPILFEAERRSLGAIASHSFMHIEHFGSTAVPGLAAKPVIDIMVAVERLEALDEIEPALASLGYKRLDVGFRKRRFYRKREVGPGVAANLHFVTADRWPDKSERLFRDWLIEHPETARGYAELKAALASRFPEDTVAYTAAKTEFIREIVNQARLARGFPPETDWD